MIVVKGLTKQFNGHTVLKGIDLEIAAGEVVAIIGPSGSGKTTFLRCLNLLETPTSGRIRVGDIEMQCDTCTENFASGQMVNLYLRPEDRVAERLDHDTPYRLNALITKVEFLGGLCIAEVTSEALHGQNLGLHYTLNQLHDLNIREGNRIDIALRAHRIRVFAPKTAAAEVAA